MQTFLFQTINTGNIVGQLDQFRATTKRGGPSGRQLKLALLDFPVLSSRLAEKILKSLGELGAETAVDDDVHQGN